MQYIPFIAFGLGVLITGGAAAFIFFQRERDFKSTIDAYARLLGIRDGEYATVLDRAFASRNLPPSKVDANKEYEEQRQAEQEAEARRGEQGDKLSRIGPVDNALIEATMEARRRAGASGAVN